MVKYKTNDSLYEIRLEDIQRAIANELAEANRLKRIELEVKTTTLDLKDEA